jgi:hypothetical protein
MRAAVEEGYNVASSEMLMETAETRIPSTHLGAKGSVSMA